MSEEGAHGMKKKATIIIKKEPSPFDDNVKNTGYCYSNCHGCINYESRISCNDFRMVMKKIGFPDCEDKRIVYISKEKY